MTEDEFINKWGVQWDDTYGELDMRKELKNDLEELIAILKNK